MIQVWTSNEKGNDKLIAFANNTIYKANPKTDEETELLAIGLKAGSFDSSKVWEIKTMHCNIIRLEDGKPYIEILWGKDGEEQLRITDERYKVFDYIKTNTPNSEFSVDKWTIFRTGKKPMIAFFVVLGLFLWTLFYAIQAQSGKVFYLENGQYNSLVGIVLGLVSIGLRNVIMLFSALLAFIRKAKSPPTMNTTLIRR